jgi:hypothetical protein
MMKNEPRYATVGAETGAGTLISLACTVEKIDRMPGLTALKITLPEGVGLDHITIDEADIMLALGRVSPL